MALSIKNDQADRLARELAATTGETLTDAVVTALRERLERVRTRQRVGVAERLRRLAAEVATAPVLDTRAPEVIVGYDEHGLPR
ncbi:MAG: type II toxin-antitoxin system VapB family antitoxin [Acidimicrobiales bacterium]